MKIEFSCIADFKRWFRSTYGYSFGDTFENGNPLTLPGCNEEARRFVEAEVGFPLARLEERLSDLNIEMTATFKPKGCYRAD